MKVTLLASTRMHPLPEDVIGTQFHQYWYSSQESLDYPADTIAHFAGRSCYQSWQMPNPDTTTNEGYMANIIKQGHFSVLEHASATFYIEGVSRNLTHELVRHRHLSYSELSQRFVDVGNLDIVTPPAIRDFPNTEKFKDDVHEVAVGYYNHVVTTLLKTGATRKQAREAARYFMPGGLETKIVVTGNHRAWRDMLFKRYSTHADAEIRELATELLRQLRLIAPATYQDFPDTPFE